MNDNYIKNVEKRMTRKIFFQTLIESAVLFVLFTVIYFVGKFVCSRKIWYSYQPEYKLLKFAQANATTIIAVLCGVSVAFLLLHACRKTYKYLSEVLYATQSIYLNKNTLIKLSPELKDIETQLNFISLNVKNNDRLAKEAEQRKNDLVVYLAHDLKTPLTSVIGYLTLLHDEEKISDELRQKYISISLDKAERLEDLINEFFEITRFNLTHLTLEISNINLKRMIEQIAYEFKPMLKGKNLTCKIYAPEDIFISCDPDKLQRVFDNLIKNAVNYSFENSEICISVVKFNNEVNIQFLNSGNTIPTEKLNRIFEQFYRLDTARTTKSGGAGLGLAIAKEIVELHKGKISAESYDEQVIFKISLPVL